MQDLQGQSSRSNRALILTVTVSVVLLLGAAVLVQRIASEANDADRRVVHTMEVRQAISNLLSSLTTAESGLRGYLITRNPTFAETCTAARDHVPQQLGRLLELMTDNSRQIARIEAAKPLVLERLGIIDKALALAQRSSTLVVVQTMGNRGSELMDDLRRRLDAVDTEESRLLQERRGRATELRTQFVTAVAAMLLVCAVLACISLFSVRRYVKALDDNRRRLGAYNTELEARVSERTTELAKATEIATRERSRAETLLTDVNHRVGNNLALVSSFLTMQQRAVKSPEAVRALSAARSRVQAIASAHRKLRLGSDFATVKANEVLGAVLEDIAAGLPPGDLIKINFQVAPLEIHARDAVSLGVLTSELVMNAIKHAFSVGDSGEVNVIFSNDGAGAPILEVTDDGKGWHEQPTQETGQGLGSRIIDMVARQFGGKPHRSAPRDDENRPGTRVRIELARLQLMPQP
jgi:two-component sensor histidine kinase/CHASE3 domain sensor protein